MRWINVAKHAGPSPVGRQSPERGTSPRLPPPQWPTGRGSNSSVCSLLRRARRRQTALGRDAPRARPGTLWRSGSARRAACPTGTPPTWHWAGSSRAGAQLRRATAAWPPPATPWPICGAWGSSPRTSWERCWRGEGTRPRRRMPASSSAAGAGRDQGGGGIRARDARVPAAASCGVKPRHESWSRFV